MASSRKDLEELHSLVARSYKTRIVQDLDDNIPTDAATLSGAVKFLKDNAITADPADQDDLSELRSALVETAKRRKDRANNVLSIVQDDLKEANG